MELARNTDAGVEVSTVDHTQSSSIEEEDPFFSDTSAMTSWPIPTTQYIPFSSSHTHALGVSPSESTLFDEPPYDPDAEYTERGAKQCFNCMSTKHVASDCPYKRNAQHVALARADYGSRGGGGRSMRLHEAEEEMKRRGEFATIFEPGYIQGDVLREGLGLNTPYNGGNEDLPWYDTMCDWGYPPGWVSFADPRERIIERIKASNLHELMEGLPSLVIFEGDEVPSSDPTPAISPTTVPDHSRLDAELALVGPSRNIPPVPHANEAAATPTIHSSSDLGSLNSSPPTIPLSNLFPLPSPGSPPPPPSTEMPPFMESPPPPMDPPPPPPDDPPPPPLSPLPPPPPLPDSLPFPPQRWAFYRTTLFQSDRLPVSLVSRPLPSLEDTPVPPSAASPPPPPPPPLEEPARELSEQEKRRMLWEKILASQAGG